MADALGTLPEETTVPIAFPAARETSPEHPFMAAAQLPRQAATIATIGGHHTDAPPPRSGMRPLSIVVVRSYLDGEPPAEQWPLLAAFAPQPARTADEAAVAQCEDAPVANSGRASGGVDESGVSDAADGGSTGGSAALASTRFSSLTLNAWGSNHLQHRRTSLLALLRHHAADIVCMQVRDACSTQLANQHRAHTHRGYPRN